jgi:hypothetical protein
VDVLFLTKITLEKVSKDVSLRFLNLKVNLIKVSKVKLVNQEQFILARFKRERELFTLNSLINLYYEIITDI